MKILSKRQASAAILESLFKPVNGRTLALRDKERFDLGKYATNPAGHDVPEHMVPHVAIVWTERRRDSDGPYWALFSIAVSRTQEAAS